MPVFQQSPTPFENDASGSSIPLAFGVNVKSGSYLLCHFSYDNSGGTVNSCGDSLNGGWTQILTVLNTPNAQRSQVWYYFNSLAGANTVTANLSGGIGFRRMAILEVAGCEPQAPDKSGSGIGTSTALSSGSVTTVGDNEYILLAAQFNGTTVSNLNGFTSRQEGTNKECALFDKVQTTAGAITGSMTLAGSTNWLAGIVTLKAARNMRPYVVQQAVKRASYW